MERLGAEPPAEQHATVMDTESRRQVQEIFAAFDKDGDGVLNRVCAPRGARRSACCACAPAPASRSSPIHLAGRSCGGVSLQPRSGSPVRLAARSARGPCLRCARSYVQRAAVARQSRQRALQHRARPRGPPS